MPPFDKSAMDGYACRKEDLSAPLEVIDYIPAGILPGKIIGSGQSSKIMTGAKIPEGADCVIMIEQTKERADGKIEFLNDDTKSNICLKGEDVKVGDIVLDCGMYLNAAMLAVAASVGKTVVHVYKPPKIALISTGDELIEANMIPEGPMIRNSNAHNLMAQISATGAKTNYLGIIGDSKSVLESAITAAFRKHDILILTGGVSMGDKDYVPEILKNMGLEVIYDKLAIQPGKPTAFAAGNGKFCFGLSGNPVSSLLQFELTAKPFIYKMMEHDYSLPIVKTVIDQSKKRKKTDRQQFFPIKLQNGMAVPIEFHGSAHIAGLVKADGFGIFEMGNDQIEAGQEIQVLLL